MRKRALEEYSFQETPTKKKFPPFPVECEDASEWKSLEVPIFNDHPEIPYYWSNIEFFIGPIDDIEQRSISTFFWHTILKTNAARIDMENVQHYIDTHRDENVVMTPFGRMYICMANITQEQLSTLLVQVGINSDIIGIISKYVFSPLQDPKRLIRMWQVLPCPLMTSADQEVHDVVNATSINTWLHLDQGEKLVWRPNSPMMLFHSGYAGRFEPDCIELCVSSVNFINQPENILSQDLFANWMTAYHATSKPLGTVFALRNKSSKKLHLTRKHIHQIGTSQIPLMLSGPMAWTGCIRVNDFTCFQVIVVHVTDWYPAIRL